MFDTPIHTNEQSIDRVLAAGRPVLLVFRRARECEPCDALEPALTRLARAHAGKLLIAKIDVADNPALAQRFEIEQLPTAILVRSSQPVARVRGAPKEPDLVSWLAAVLEGRSVASLSGASIPLGRPAPRSAPSSDPQPRRSASTPASGGGTPLVLTDRTFAQVIGQGDQPVLVDFWAPWCGPCRMVAPTVEQLAREFDGRARVAKLNVDENPRTSERFGIRSIPALYIFHNGKPVEQFVGVQPASVLRAALARYCAPS